MPRVHATIKDYFKEHWVSMAISMATSGIVFLIALINIFIAFRIDYASLKDQVYAGSSNYKTSLQNQQQLLIQVTAINQKVTDQTADIKTINHNLDILTSHLLPQQ